jgi:hypothetical protein
MRLLLGLSADGLLMPAKNKAAPDLQCFNKDAR